MDEIEPEELLVEKTLLHVCYMDKDESKSIIVDEISKGGIESECVHKNINKEKDAKNEAYHE